MDASRPTWLKGPEPALAAFAALLPFLGLAILGRRSVVGGLLLGAALWTALCLAPSRAVRREEMPRRYAYYYFPDGHRPADLDRSDAVLPVLLALGGTALLVRERHPR